MKRSRDIDDESWRRRAKYAAQPYRAIVEAAQRGNYEDVKFFLEAGDDVNTQLRGYTPLIKAIEFKHKRIVDLLLANNADVNVECREKSALHYAIDNEDSDLVEQILEGSATRAKYVFKTRGVIETDRVALSSPVPFFPTCYCCKVCNNPSILSMLIINLRLQLNDLSGEEGVRSNTVNKAPNLGFPLYFAVKYCRNLLVRYLVFLKDLEPNRSRQEMPHSLIVAIEYKRMAKYNVEDYKNTLEIENVKPTVEEDYDYIIDWLVLRCKDGINYGSNTSMTPLTCCIKNSDVRTLKLLIKKNVNFNKTALGRQPIHYAIEQFYTNGNLEIVELVVQHSSEVQHDYWNIFAYAIITGSNEEKTLELIKYLKTVRSINVKSAMFWAVDRNFKNLINFLLTQPWIGHTNNSILEVVITKLMDFKDGYYMELLDELIKRGIDLKEGAPIVRAISNPDVLKTLIDKNIPYNVKDKNGYSPLMLAFDNKQEKSARILLNQPDIDLDVFVEINVSTDDILLTNSCCRHTALSLAPASFKQELLKRVDPFLNIIAALVNFSFDDIPILLKRYKKSEETDTLIQKEVFRVMQELVVFSRYGRSLDIAENKFMELCNIFGVNIEYEGFKVRNVVDDEAGFTPIYFAIMGNFQNVVKNLLERVDINYQAKNGETILHLAIDEGKEKIVEMISKKNPKPLKNKYGFTAKAMFSDRVKNGVYENNVVKGMTMASALGLGLRKIDFIPILASSAVDRYELTDCAICLNSLQQSFQGKEISLDKMLPISENKYLIPNTVRLPCGHGYHLPCISRWAQNINTCPQCKTEFPIRYLRQFSNCYLILNSAPGTSTSRIVKNMNQLKF